MIAASRKLRRNTETKLRCYGIYFPATLAESVSTWRNERRFRKAN